MKNPTVGFIQEQAEVPGLSSGLMVAAELVLREEVKLHAAASKGTAQSRVSSQHQTASNQALPALGRHEGLTGGGWHSFALATTKTFFLLFAGVFSLF